MSQTCNQTIRAQVNYDVQSFERERSRISPGAVQQTKNLGSLQPKKCRYQLNIPQTELRMLKEKLRIQWGDCLELIAKKYS